MYGSIVEAVLEYASIQPDKLCLADDNIKVTYSEYADKILKFASYLSNNGIKRNDKVVVEACQTVDYLAIELALQLLGAVFVPVEHNCAAEKIKAFALRAEATAVIATKDNDFGTQYFYSFDNISENADKAEKYIVTEYPNTNSISEILFSTGTTGKEKGIIITHANDIALAENVLYGVKMEKDNVEMIPSPMNHSHGLRRYYANMFNGSTVILLGSVMNVKQFFFNMDTYGVNSLDLVPTALSVLLKLTKNKFSEYADKIRYIQFGAAPMMDSDKAAIRALLPKTRLYNFYGSTESGCICIYDFNRDDEKKSCIGKPAYNAQIVIVDDERNPINSSKDNTGLLSSKGKMNMPGYWQDEEETAKALAGGVVYSNDVAYFDEDGDIILLGRRGDVINVGGNKVSPDEIEDAAKKMECIEDCGVIPVEDKFKGHVPKLIVQLKKGAEFDPIAIRSFLSANLEPYKVPAFIETIDLIPRSFNGKLLRKNLK